jgi:hypothetical protein
MGTDGENAHSGAGHEGELSKRLDALLEAQQQTNVLLAQIIQLLATQQQRQVSVQQHQPEHQHPIRPDRLRPGSRAPEELG